MYLGSEGVSTVAMDTKELMIKMENPNHHHHHHDMDIPFSSLPVALDSAAAFGSDHLLGDEDQKSSLGFMELLSFQDFTHPSSYSSIFDSMMMYQPPSSLSMEMEVPVKQQQDDKKEKKELLLRVDEVGEESSVVLNGQPSSPNSSSISSPAAVTVDRKPLKQCMKAKKTMGGDETQTKTKKKKEREARFAFMTRTEIDHLDDGYRWRKYGQKAVKNSPFPRSYYRCTSASCNVKKRVERCMGDPSFVVTTYEGQHIHPSPSTTTANYSFNHHFNNTNNIIDYALSSTPTPAMLKIHHGPAGLLQHMLP